MKSSSSTSTAHTITYTAFGAAIITLCSIIPPITIAGISVPLTLQVFAVLTGGGIFGKKIGTFSALLYLLLGFLGLPIFAGYTGGLASLQKPSIGYLLAFPVATFIVGFCEEYLTKNPKLNIVAGMLLATAIIHIFGVSGVMLTTGLVLNDAVKVDLLFVPLDLIKAFLAYLVTISVRTRYSELLPSPLIKKSS